MATFSGSPPFFSLPLTKARHISSSPAFLPNPPLQPQPPASSPHLTSSFPQESAQASIKAQQQRLIEPATKVESIDWTSNSLTRRSGLAWVAFLSAAVISQQIKTPLGVFQHEAYTRNIEKEEEVVQPDGIRYYELKVGLGASPGPGDLVVIDMIGKVEGSGEVFVDTFGNEKKAVTLIMGSRPYIKGVCEGIENVVRSMKAGGKRRVIVPPTLGFGENGADLGSGWQIPPLATLEYIVEIL